MVYKATGYKYKSVQWAALGLKQQNGALTVVTRVVYIHEILLEF